MRDATASVEANGSSAAPRLRRVLSLWDLIFYGIVLIQPIAPVPLFGVVQARSHGYVVDTILIAMFAMMITAFSYGRMAALYPSAGSAYTYVGRGLNLHLGFLVGWAMFLDYLLQPLLNAVWVAQTIRTEAGIRQRRQARRYCLPHPQGTEPKSRCAAASMQMYRTTMFGPSGLLRADRETPATGLSWDNHCFY